MKLIPSKSSLVNGNIYPVPNLKNPFLGGAFYKNINGDAYVGPMPFRIWPGKLRHFARCRW